MLKRIQKTSRVSFSNDFSKLANFDVIFTTHDTELTGNNRLGKLNTLIDRLIPNISNNTTLVLVSQVPVGFCRELYQKIEVARPGVKFNLVHMIDTFIMTRAIECFTNPSRIVLGFEKSPYKVPANFQKVLDSFECPKLLISWESAEVTKASTNVYLATSVTFANTISDICEVSGANMSEVIPALRLDKRIGQFAYLRPSTGIAGGHIERDLQMFTKLSKQKNARVDLIKLITKLNKNRYKWVLKKLQELSLKSGSNITIWGLAYKKDSESTMNAPSVKIIKELQKKYKINVYDPKAKLPKNLSATQFSDKYQALKNADCLIILTEWDEFSNPNLKKVAAQVSKKNIIDSVGILQNNKSSLQAFNYLGMGQGEN